MPLPRSPRLPRAIAVSSLVLLVSCAAAAPLDDLAKPPAFAPTNETKCGVAGGQREPLIVEWPSAERGRLEMQTQKGIVAVHYSGCEMKVLPGCQVKGGYSYTALTTKRDRVKIADTDGLYANLPAHAVKFEATLKRSGELNVTMTVVGRYAADRPVIMADELTGDCAAATHVLGAFSVGAFDFFAGADASVGAGVEVAGQQLAGGKSDSHHETLAQDGEDAACGNATAGDLRPPDGCGALLRIEVVPIGKPRCPVGTIEQGDTCVAVVNTRCPAGLRFEKGVGCVDKKPMGAAGAGTGVVIASTVVKMVSVSGLAGAPSFELDETEVTVTAFETCVGAGKCDAHGLDSSWGCNFRNEKRGAHPINCVDWAQAHAYCAWVGKRLPTEAEWVAGAYATDGRMYPWGTNGPSMIGSTSLAPCWGGTPNDAKEGKREGTCPVKSHSTDRASSGLYDLAGNLREWTATADGANKRVARGGGWQSTALAELARDGRASYEPSRRAGDVGFRCAR